MVQTDLTQLNRECSSWKEHLRSFRSELSDCRQRLQDAVSHPLKRGDLPHIEHYSNQFDIQLSNINHLKHAIKEHEKIASWEINNRSGNVSDATWAAHENLHDQYQVLEHTLSDLKEEFSSFVIKIR